MAPVTAEAGRRLSERYLSHFRPQTSPIYLDIGRRFEGGKHVSAWTTIPSISVMLVNMTLYCLGVLCDSALFSRNIHYLEKQLRQKYLKLQYNAGVRLK